LKAIYPDFVPSKHPRGHWQNKESQKAFFDQLAIKLNIQKLDDWNKVTTKTVVKEGGAFIVNYYNQSLTQGTNVSYYSDNEALQAVYPDYVPTEKFRDWTDIRNQRAFFDQLAMKLNIKKLEDWDKVNTDILRKDKEGWGFVARYYSSSLRRGTNAL
jgi:hypothetical protein